MSYKKTLLIGLVLTLLVAMIYLVIYLIAGKTPELSSINLRLGNSYGSFYKTFNHAPISRLWDILTLPMLTLCLISIFRTKLRPIPKERNQISNISIIGTFFFTTLTVISLNLACSIFGILSSIKSMLGVGGIFGLIPMFLCQFGMEDNWYKQYKDYAIFILLMFCLCWNIIFGLPGMILGVINYLAFVIPFVLLWMVGKAYRLFYEWIMESYFH